MILLKYKMKEIKVFLETAKIYQENLTQHRETHKDLKKKLESINNEAIRKELLDFYEVSDMLHSQASMNLIVAKELLLDKS